MANTNRDQINSAMGGSQDPNQDDYQQAMGGGQYGGGTPTPTPTPTPGGPTFASTVSGTLSAFSLVQIAGSETSLTPNLSMQLPDLIAGDVLWIVEAEDVATSVNVLRHYHVLTDADLDAPEPRTFNFTPPLAAGQVTRVFAAVTQRGAVRSGYGPRLIQGPGYTAPNITSALVFSRPENDPFSFSIVLDQPALLPFAAVSGFALERATSDTALLTTHTFRMAGNAAPDYDTGQQQSKVSVQAVNAYGRASDAQTVTLNITDVTSDNPQTSGFDNALEEEDYDYQDFNRIVVKKQNSNASLAAVGVTSHSTGIWAYAVKADPSLLPNYWISGLKDASTGSYGYHSGGEYYKDGVQQGQGTAFGFNAVDEVMNIINFDSTDKVLGGITYPARSMSFRKNGAVAGQAVPLPTNLINGRIYLGVSTPIGSKVGVNTGQYPPAGGWPTGVSQWN